MSVGITLDELFEWNNEVAQFWKTYFAANPSQLELPCGIGGASNVQDFVRHVWGVELRWAQRLAGLPVTAKEDMAAGPLEALFALHLRAAEIFRGLLAAPEETWSRPLTLDLPWLPPELRSMSRRKIAAHALFHAHRHWAQLATLLRIAGFPSGFRGDLLFSQALD
jgi:uncharacterized damage-inducible protein DinB